MSFFLCSNLNNNNIKLLTSAVFGPVSTIGGAGEYHYNRKTSLNGLYLDANGIEGISYDAFQDIVVNNIHLSNNNLTSFPRALKTITPGAM